MDYKCIHIYSRNTHIYFFGKYSDTLLEFSLNHHPSLHEGIDRSTASKKQLMVTMMPIYSKAMAGTIHRYGWYMDFTCKSEISNTIRHDTSAILKYPGIIE